MDLSALSYTQSNLTTLVLGKESQNARCLTLPVGMLVAMAIFMSVMPVHAESVPLSTLTANPSAEIIGRGGLSFSHFTYTPLGPLPSLEVNDISVSTDSVSSTQSRIRFGLFTAAADDRRFGTITYQVSTASPITDFHLVTPAAVIGGQPGRAFEDAGYLLTTDVTGVGTTFISRVGLGVGLGPADNALHSQGSLQPPPFPTNVATLTVINRLQIFGGEGSGTFGNPNNSLTLPYFDNVYTVSVVPEPSTWLLLASGIIVLMMSKLRAPNLHRYILTPVAWMILGVPLRMLDMNRHPLTRTCFGRR